MSCAPPLHPGRLPMRNNIAATNIPSQRPQQTSQTTQTSVPSQASASISSSQSQRDSRQEESQENLPLEIPIITLDLRKRKYNEFAVKAVLENDSKSTRPVFLKPYKKSGKHFNYTINPVVNPGEVLCLGLKQTYKVMVDISEVPEDELPPEPDTEDSDNDLDDNIDKEVTSTFKKRHLDDYEKYAARFPKLTKRLLETLEFKDHTTLIACLATITEERDNNKRRDNNLIKKEVITWIPHVWQLMAVNPKAVEGCLWPIFQGSHKTLRVLFTGPTSALGPKTMKTKPGNADILKLVNVTAEMIAYSAMQCFLATLSVISLSAFPFKVQTYLS
ncbi:hypothetical protein BDP27DRAFT_1363476 [Rhodocollybia butyracea]|uniref:Uncharacterized protein n=1 Tax=Rhodocollybia butyracea TaxID=206335 RepID=A0A9P5PVN4_9AGAR|nr:hypothetical protein BDP27DRAFT_1363476 [Rhodocollybia butyracea]